MENITIVKPDNEISSDDDSDSDEDDDESYEVRNKVGIFKVIPMKSWQYTFNLECKIYLIVTLRFEE